MGSTNRLAIMRQACLRAGVEPIESLTDDSDECRVLTGVYDDLVEAYLERGLWKFVKKQALLTRLSTAPTARYSAIYQLPADLLFLEAVYVGGALLTDYDLYKGNGIGKYLYCDCTADQELVADYIFNGGEAYWAPTFKHVVISALAELLATGLREDGKMADYFSKQTQSFTGVAAARDDQQQPARQIRVSRFLTQRRSKGRLGIS